MTLRPPHFTRRAVLTAAGTATSLLAARSAEAQFSLFDIPSLLGSTLNVLKGMSLNERDEIQMGQHYYGRFIAESGGIYRNSAAQRALRDFAEPLFRTSRRPALPWEITLLDDDTVNAWALPGGKLAVNKGVLRYAAEPDELAAVIAHEIGHAELSHVLGQMKTEAFARGVGQVGMQALSAYGGAAGGLTASVLDALEGPIFKTVTSGYSQSAEFEADAHILTVFGATGYAPQKASRIFATLLQLVPPHAKETSSLFASHPGTRQRIAKLDEKAATMQAIAIAPQSAGWPGLKATFPTREYFRRHA